MRYSPPYSAYARIYDQIGQRAFGERMAAVILELIEKRQANPETVLDLGCGTGSATLAFARAGLQATGIDLSPDMLAVARQATSLEELPATFIKADMTEFHLDQTFDLATCIYDAFNYLPDDGAVERFFHCVSDHLELGGHFVFDMNTRSRLTSSLEQGLLLAADADDLFVTYRSWFDSAIDASPLVVTAFMRTGKGAWERFDEEHIERAWPIDRVQLWLRNAGFRVIDVLGYVDSTGEVEHPAREEHGRVLFVACR